MILLDNTFSIMYGISILATTQNMNIYPNMTIYFKCKLMLVIYTLIFTE